MYCVFWEALLFHTNNTGFKILISRDFLGGPVFKNLPSKAVGTGLTPILGAKIPHVWQPKQPKTFKIVHIKKTIYKKTYRLLKKLNIQSGFHF